MSHVIKINVPQGYKPNIDLDKLKPTDGKLLIDYGGHMLAEHHKMVGSTAHGDQVNTLNTNIDKLTNELQLARQRYSDLQLHNDTVVNDIRNEKSNQLADVRSEWCAKLKQANDEITTLRSSKESALIEQRDVMLAKLDPLTKLYSLSTLENGQSGEALVENILPQIFTACVIENVSHTDHSRDILFNLAEMNIRALVEVHNKSTLCLSDVNKFHREIMEQREKINCALFISINTPNIPTKGNFTVDFHGGKPVIYMHMQSADMVKYAIQMLGLIIKHVGTTGGRDDTHDDHQDVVDLISEIYNSVRQGAAKMHRIKMSIAQLSRLANDTSVIIDRSVDSIVSFYTKYDMFKDDNLNTDSVTKYTDDDMVKLSSYVKKNQTIPNRDQISSILGMSEVSIRKRGGVRKLKKILKQHIRKNTSDDQNIMGRSDDDLSDYPLGDVSD